MNSVQFLGAIEMGLIYGFVALGVFLTFRVIRFTDLTVDGSFVLGSSLTAVLLLNDVPPLMTTCLASSGAFLAGLLTGYLHVRFQISDLLSGILTATALYSINLRIMGRPNLVLLNEATLFSNHSPTWVLVFLALITCALLTFFFATEKGLAVRALGDNGFLLKSYGVEIRGLTISIVGVSNGLIGLGGSLFVQSQGFADISMGLGTVLIGLAAVILGEVFHFRAMGLCLIGCIFGSILYRICLALALNSDSLGLKASDINLITALLVMLAMVLPRIQSKKVN